MKTVRAPEFESHRAVIRERGHSVTPYRLGLESGRRLDNLPAPYAPGSHGERLYRDGVKYASAFGRILRAALLSWLKEPV